MKGIICYYSGSGNTKLACQFIAKHTSVIEFDLLDVVKNKDFDLNAYDVIGFATWADFAGPPQLFKSFIERIPEQTGKWAFVLNTYGFINGTTLLQIARLVKTKGFRVLSGHQLHTPESYPPMIASGNSNAQAPNAKELKSFNSFAVKLNTLLNDLKAGQVVRPQSLKVSLLDRLIPAYPRTHSRKDMGEKFVDEITCNACGICQKICPYQAIVMNPKPVFDQQKCYGCWTCYNHCPNKAIYTHKYRGVGHYPKPIDELKKKLETLA